jgi:CheY-like chemotaxis protein
MDQEMPVMDGMKCTQTIRAWEKDGLLVSHVPVIGVTANARVEQIQALLLAGMVCLHLILIFQVSVIIFLNRMTSCPNLSEFRKSCPRLKNWLRLILHLRPPHHLLPRLGKGLLSVYLLQDKEIRRENLLVFRLDPRPCQIEPAE